MTYSPSLDRLKSVLQEVDTELIVTTRQMFPEVFHSWLEQNGVLSVAVGSDALLGELDVKQMAQDQKVGIADLSIHDSELHDADRWHQILAGTDAGITSAIGIAEETGSVLLIPHSPDERAISLLPPIHLIVLEQSKVVPDIATLIKRWQDVGAEGSNVFVTGPSRTADIEKELVLGVHGPMTVTVILLG